MEQLYRQMNALVRTQEQRDNIKTQLQNDPVQLDARHDGFFLEGNKVMYNLPNGDTLQLLMTDEEVKNKMKLEYDKPENAGKGLNNLYWYMKQSYLNITRKTVELFLKSNEQYALTQKTKPRVNKSVVSSAKYPNAIWAIDLIEMSDQFNDANTVVTQTNITGRRSTNKRVLYRYIFSCLDVFSRKIWLYPLSSKETAEYTTEALRDIIRRASVQNP